MRILWLRPSKGDHISVRRERIASYLIAEGYEVTIRDASLFDAPGAIWEALTGEYDIIAGNVRMGLFIGYPIARLRGLPILGDVSDPISDIDYIPWPLRPIFEWLEWRFLTRADAAVFVYESSFDEAKKRGIDGVRLPNVVDHEAFARPEQDVIDEAADILNAAGVSLDRPVAIYLGGFSHSYHIVDIIESAREATDWQFVFVGEGKLVAEVREGAASLDNVYYPGAFAYELMPGFLAHADVGFCFKDAEQPLKLKEYAAAGIPVIAQPGELSRWYADNELVFTPPTPEAICETLETLRDDSTRQAYVDALTESLDQRTWADIASSYHHIFETIATTEER